MARSIVEIITSDLTNEPNATPIAFGYKGQQYTIDLTESEAAELDDALQVYLAKATKVRDGKPRTRVSTGVAVRKWAASNGIQVSDRGRIPRTVVDQFFAANP